MLWNTKKSSHLIHVNLSMSESHKYIHMIFSTKQNFAYVIEEINRAYEPVPVMMHVSFITSELALCHLAIYNARYGNMFSSKHA